MNDLLYTVRVRFQAGGFTAIAGLTLALAMGATAHQGRADDWPQWLGPNRDGVWRETGVLEKLPAGGPKVLWRAPVNRGYCGPAVANGSVILLDRVAGKMPERKPGDRTVPEIPGNERVFCLDARTGAWLTRCAGP